MCGIAGIISFKKINMSWARDVSRKLLEGIESRGRDATGMAIINPVTNTFKVIKDPIKASEFVQEPRFRDAFTFKDAQIILLHTRLATQGTKAKNVNNHPFYDKETQSVLVHNGIINNDSQVDKEHDLKCDGDCDSETILRASLKLGVRKAIAELSGNAAFALFTGQDKILSLFAEDNPLVLAWIPSKSCFVFASTESAIEYALNEFRTTRVFGVPFVTKQVKTDYKLSVFVYGQLMQFRFGQDKVVTYQDVKMRPYVYNRSGPGSLEWRDFVQKYNRRNEIVSEKDSERNVDVSDSWQDSYYEEGRDGEWKL
jgi:glucosamine 6-phosphate synthetase-like amidotransferase/phosphosugar isomerase protein